ncbi:MAG: carbon starvation protein A, partial [Candidatus Marinamargulisbacteria bacterium]
MNGLILLWVAIIAFSMAYIGYGRWLSRSLFGLNYFRKTPAHRSSDGIDYVPSSPGLVFGHHFTSIAGTGPIVGPAIGVIWGWGPAFIWVVLGAIFIGGIHDFGALVLSLRHDGRSICDIAGDLISSQLRRYIFGVVLLALWIVMAIFGLIIAIIFNLFPEAVLPVWFEIPIALAFGFFLRRYPKKIRWLTVLAIGGMAMTVVLGHFIPIKLGGVVGIPATGVWTIILLVYAWWASVLPVQTLLQPRDFLNAWQLIIAMGLLLLGAMVSGMSGHLMVKAP